MKLVAQFINGVFYLFSSLASGASLFLSDKSLEDFEGFDYFEHKKDRENVEEALEEIRNSEKRIGERTVGLQNGDSVTVFIS